MAEAYLQLLGLKTTYVGYPHCPPVLAQGSVEGHLHRAVRRQRHHALGGDSVVVPCRIARARAWNLPPGRPKCAGLRPTRNRTWCWVRLVTRRVTSIRSVVTLTVWTARSRKADSTPAHSGVNSEG